MKVKAALIAKSLSVLLIIAAASLALAQNTCKNVYGPSAANFRRSIEMRQKMQVFFETRLRQVTDLRESLIAKLMSEIAKSWQQKEDLKKIAPQDVGGIPLDFSQIPNVWISKETLSALQSAFGPDVWHLSPQQHQALIEHAEKTARKDPYLQWLNRHYSLSVPVPERPEIDSVRILFDVYLKPAYPLGLPPRLAFLRLYELLDPNVTDAQRKMMVDLVKLQRVKNTLQEDVENLHESNKSAGAWDAAGLAPSLEEARVNLQEILVRQERKFGTQFPRASFERAHILIRKRDPAVEFLFHFIPGSESKLLPTKSSSPAAKVGSAESLAMDRMESLKTRLGLPAEFPTEKLGSAMRILFRMANRQTSASYQSFLAEAFADGQSAQVPMQIKNLETLIEYMQSMQDADYYFHSLHERAHRLYQTESEFDFPLP
jgi:hypothetical protein